MIQIIPTTLSGTSPSLYGVTIDENVCGSYNIDNMPTVAVTALNNGSIVVSGGVSLQKITISVTITYQPCENCSSTKVKTYAETVTVSVPGSATSITPTISQSVSTTPIKYICGSKAMGIRIQTSLSVAYA